jgi:sugar-specific transcriptional regulator TrmB
LTLKSLLRRFNYAAKDVMRITGTPQSSAYEIIRMLNKELRDQGYLTRNGRVEKRYLLERFRIIDAPEVPCGD